ncbi:Bicarbonate transport ATP-binding protein CmpC [Pelagimonas phthalicica]|uniref:Bicarbonate transport ATP-binding protein CmpC n=1 Tax=Pelagimonas phthalicica TaxID=1037362 RepID=A0A238J9K7_9RHOB|nr:ABC transporter substrate-binding protein [Pelagimonas phthalicica]TDS94063.1 NitT/TauT family transport system ATP-binding protein [Pelagimonas phthalicica]SMX27411.1 Bicarbonate transport ATP-binding protein CmpC [Pelagimonas phthalicica]
MKTHVLPVGYIPLVDAAPLIVAQEMGFAAQEGLVLDLKRAPSWSGLRDMLAFGQVDAAHMLSPIPVASALGLGSAGVHFDAIMVLSINGNVIGVGKELAHQLQDQGHDFSFNDPTKAGRALIAAAKSRLRIGVPFPFSMHAELLYYWLTALGLPAPQNVDIRTIPPALMADALKAGEVDAFCVGEPWGSISVDHSEGALLLPGAAIWKRAPEKVLAVRSDWVQSDPAIAHRLIRAIWRACAWLAAPGSRMLASELLSRGGYLNLPTEIMDRALTGTLTVTPQGLQRHCANFLEFHDGSANFPWRSQAQWIAGQLAARTGLDRVQAMDAASTVFRADLFRQALRQTTANLPGASAKIEGGNTESATVAGESGSLILPSDSFFDGQIFDPSQPA